MNSDFCQLERLHPGSQPVSAAAVFVSKTRWRIRQKGFWNTLNRVIPFALKKLGLCGLDENRIVEPALPKEIVSEPLDLSPGEWVEVKSEAEIHETLDEFGRHRGMLFMPEMTKYCGKRLQVMKRVEQMLLESTMQVRKMTGTVLLHGAMCDGVGLPCDRSCFFFWREAWLRRATPADQNGAREDITSPEPHAIGITGS